MTSCSIVSILHKLSSIPFKDEHGYLVDLCSHYTDVPLQANHKTHFIFLPEVAVASITAACPSDGPYRIPATTTPLKLCLLSRP